MPTLSDEMTTPAVPPGRSTAARAFVARSNESIALRMTLCFGSIWCVYAFTVFSLVPLLFPGAQNTLLYVSNCIQLVALPALMVGSALLARSGEQRAAQDHLALVEILADVREELAEIKEITAEVRAHRAAANGG
ncbi:MAG: hypothetical protein INR65_00415 [Gluconacetobacter diazotrophicus]|nr:hypothetical protein [Gluconacetobacter diazotrophicus]